MHYAVFVSSSYRSGWSTSSSARSAVRAIVHSIATASAQASSADGSCCCRKGKCKQSSAEAFSCGDDLDCGPAVSHRSSEELRTLFFRTHGQLRRARRIFASTLTHNGVSRTSPSYIMFSRSIASAASVPKRQATTLSSRQPEAPVSETQMHLLNFRDKNFPHSREHLEEAWKAFRTEEDMKTVDTRELLDFGGMIIRETNIEGSVVSNSVDWGNRLQRVVLELRRRGPFRSLSDTLQVDCISIVTQALQGNPDDAGLTLAILLDNAPSASSSSWWVLDTFKHVMLSYLQHSGAARAVEFYLDHYSALKQVLTKAQSNRRLTHTYTRLFPELSATFKAMESPASYLASVKEAWDTSRIYRLGITIIRVFCRENMAEDALEVYQELKRQNLPILYYLRHALVRALTKAHRYEQANLLYLDIAPAASADEAEKRSYDATGLYLCAHQGDVERAEECFARLSARGGVLQQEMTLVLHASAVQGDTDRVQELFHQFFGTGDPEPGRTLQKPNAFHYSTIINAHAIRDDVNGMTVWLGRMMEDGCTPDIATYNTVLKAVAQRDDVRTLEELLNQMRDAGVPPDKYSYTTIIKILARRRDVLGAEAMMKRMEREGVVLDRIAVTTLLNAHVEAGNWRGVIHVFDYIKGARLKDIKQTIEVFNALLKSYVLIGAPLEVVVGIFRQLEETDLKPTNRTFALLIQAACDSKRMDIASQLFAEMETLETDWTTDVEVTREVLTIIMVAYLRQGNRDQARAIYDDMQRRGITPTAYTYASILKSYADENIEENVRIVQKFLDSLVSQPDDQRDWEQPTSGRESALAMIYAPVLNSASKKLDVETAERLYKEFIDQKKEPTIPILTILLDAYRRVGDVRNVQHVWSQIYELALGRTDEVDRLLNKVDVDDKFFRSRRRGDLLCVPLSMYVDALSHAGHHTEIAQTWNKLREAGFQFDAHNWNHLVIALVRAGQPARAFEVVEKVIIPYQIQSHHILRSRMDKVDSPLVFSNEKTRGEIEDEPYIRPTERSYTRRAKLLERLRRRFKAGGLHGRKGHEAADLAAELHLLQQISPEWNVWRPHNVTLLVLARTLETLDSGRLIRPLEPRDEPLLSTTDEKDDHSDADEDEDDEDHIDTPPPSREEARDAHKLLTRIFHDSPRTITAIDTWDSQMGRNAARQSRTQQRQTKKQLWEAGRFGRGSS